MTDTPSYIPDVSQIRKDFVRIKREMKTMLIRYGIKGVDKEAIVSMSSITALGSKNPQDTFESMSKIIENTLAVNAGLEMSWEMKDERSDDD